MSLYTALGITIGVLIAIWTFVAVGFPNLGLIVWAGIIAWGAFYAAGGGTAGLKKTIAAHIAGIILAFLALLVHSKLAGGAAPLVSTIILGILVGIIAFIMCIEANVPLLAFIPGAFMGAATYVGAAVGGGGATGRTLIFVAISMAIGAILGFISEAWAKKLATRRGPAEA